MTELDEALGNAVSAVDKVSKLLETQSIDNNPPNGGRAENEYLADIINKWGHMPEACLDMIKSAINPVEGE